MLLDPKEPTLRTALWIALDLSLMLLLTDLGLLRTQTHTIDLLGVYKEEEHLNQFHFALTTVLLSIIIVYAAIETWPPQEPPLHPIPFTLQPPTVSVPLTLTPATPKLIPPLKMKIVPPANGQRGPNQASQAEPALPPPESQLYPIVLVGQTQVKHTTDPPHISISVSVSNTTTTEANVHVELHATAYNNGVQMLEQPINPIARDVGLGPPPFSYQLSSEVGLSTEGEQQYTTLKTVYIIVDLTASYPDRGGTTTYYFEGKTNPDLDHLDAVSSHWEQTTK